MTQQQLLSKKNQWQNNPYNSEIFYLFVSNSKCVNSVSSEIAIDEMLVPFVADLV